MSTISDAFNQWLRHYVADGIPGSGVNAPSKAEGRAIGSLIESYVAAAIADGVSSGGAAKLMLDCGDETTVLTPGEVKRFRLPYGLSLTEVRASLTSPSVSGDSPNVDAVRVDIELVGDSPPVSILGDVLQIDGGDTTSVGSVAPPSIVTSELDDNAELVIKVLDEGTGAAGLKVHMIGTWAAFGVGAIPYFVSSEAGVATSVGSSCGVLFPAGAAADDIAFLMVRTEARAGGTIPEDFIRPSGWNTLYNGIAHSISQSAIFWRRLDGSEGSSVAVNTTGGNGTPARCAYMSLWRGCVQNGDPFESLDVAYGSSATMAGGATATLGANRRAINFYTNHNSPSDPDGLFVEVFDDPATSMPNPHYFVASALAEPIPATTAIEDRVLGGSVDWERFSLALVPGTS